MTRAVLRAVEDEVIGRTIAGKYRIVRLLGIGGMGSVYEAKHLQIGRRFAIKFINSQYQGNAELLARFKREAEAAGGLEHENIAAVTDFGKAERGRPYIVMEFLEGESLGSLIEREGPLPLPAAIATALQVARGLAAAHARGIIHRDLKPENVFVTKRPDGGDLLKILDFGIAKLRISNSIGSATQTGTTLGTPYYMSPEQARGDEALDHRADVYSLGVMLFEMLTRQLPYDGDGHNAVIHRVLNGVPVRFESLRPDLPKELAHIIHRAFHYSADARYQSADELLAALMPFALPATPTPSSTSARRVAYRSRLTLFRTLALGTALGVVICMAVVALLREREAAGLPQRHENQNREIVTARAVAKPPPPDSLETAPEASSLPRPQAGSATARKLDKPPRLEPKSKSNGAAQPKLDPYSP